MVCEWISDSILATYFEWFWVGSNVYDETSDYDLPWHFN